MDCILEAGGAGDDGNSVIGFLGFDFTPRWSFLKLRSKRFILFFAWKKIWLLKIWKFSGFLLENLLPFVTHETFWLEKKYILIVGNSES